jgi:aldose 1-epimerase
MPMALHAFGTTDDGLTVTEVSLALPSGLAASILDRGAVVRDLKIPTRNGASQRLVLGYRDLAGYCADQDYLGALAGRHANRIAAGRFTLDGKTHQLTLNEHGRTHLHGGLIGFSRRVWRILEHTDASVTLGLTSPAGEEGYPGRLEAFCTYRLVDPGTLSIHMTAQSDLPTIVNFAHHSYFTLNYGHSIRDHLLQIDADHYTPTDPDLIPTGAIVAVADTPFDFRHLRPIAALDIPYDINFVLRRAQGGLYRAARLQRPGAGIAMEVYTTEPGLQFYDGSYLRASHPGLDGRPHFPHAGLCLEPGRFPDGPHHPNFPSPVLRPGEVYRQTTEYRFLDAD